MSLKTSEIVKIIKETPENMIPEVVKEYIDDERSLIQKAILSANKRYDKYLAENARLEVMAKFEKEYSDYEFICGIDEVGRGPLAGPVMAGAVILPKESRIRYINDSKKLSEEKREELFLQIKEEAVAFAIGESSEARIDEINILQATFEAMRSAISKLDVKPDLLLNDAVTIPDIQIRQIPIIKGDAKSMSIAAASIIAKVTRDHLMDKYDEMYPEYGFKKNKGYGTAAHIDAIKEHGPCPIHRQTFIKNFI